MENLQGAFEIMVIGMSGIFIALGIIYLASTALLKNFPKTDEKE